MEIISLQEELFNLGYQQTYVIPGLEKAFIGVSNNDNAVYDNEKIDEMPNYQVPEGMQEPIFIDFATPEALDCEVVVLEPRILDKAIIGVTDSNRAVYDYDQLVNAFMDDFIDKEAFEKDNDGFETPEEKAYFDAVEWIDYNTLRSLPYVYNSPIILYSLTYMLEGSF